MKQMTLLDDSTYRAPAPTFDDFIARLQGDARRLHLDVTGRV